MEFVACQVAGGTGTGVCPSSSLFTKPVNLTFVYSAISINVCVLSHIHVH